MLKRIFLWLLTIPAALFLVTLAVANRHEVLLVLDPFNPKNPVISQSLPFYMFLFAALVIGVILGGTATWMTQSKWRQTARKRTQEAMRWQAEADRLIKERDAQVSAAKRLVAPAA
jgi:uncharacterized integral membrane protein